MCRGGCHADGPDRGGAASGGVPGHRYAAAEDALVLLPAAWLLPMPVLAANVCIFAVWPSWCAPCCQRSEAACVPARM